MQQFDGLQYAILDPHQTTDNEGSPSTELHFRSSSETVSFMNQIARCKPISPKVYLTLP